MKIPQIAILVTDQFSPFHLSIPCAVFGGTDPILFNIILCSGMLGLQKTNDGFAVYVSHGLDALEQADIIVIPFWADPNICPEEKLCKLLQKAYKKGVQLVGLCLGTYVLAYAGILDGKKASTHWAFENDFVKRFPNVCLDTNVLYSNDSGVMTSAGSAAGLDCCLHIIQKHYGSKVANQVARRMVVAPHREGGQSQFFERPLPVTSDDEKMSALLEKLYLHPNLFDSVSSLAYEVMMGRRTFTRNFRKATGMSVMEWLTLARIQRSQELLEVTNHSIEEISFISGFRSAASFRNHFKSHTGVTPRKWRKNFFGNEKN